MLRVFKNRYPGAQVTFSSGSEVLVHMDFADAKANPEAREEADLPTD